MNRTRELVVGAVILAGLAVGVVGSLWLSGSGFGRPSNPLTVMVADVGQLRQGNTVKYRGVPIGRVDRFELTPSGDGIAVRLLLDREIPPVEELRAILAPESLFGEWQVELVSLARFPGFEYFEIPGGMVLEDGGEPVPGFAMPDITRLTAAANEISQNLAVLTDRVDRAFNEETAENVRVAIANIQEMSESLRSLAGASDETFHELSDDVRQATADISAAAAVARSTLDRADRLLASGQLDSIVEDVAAASRDLATLSRAAGASADRVERTVASADSLFLRLNRIAGRIEDGEGVLGQLMNDSVMVERTADVLLRLDLLLEDFMANPKRYVRLSIF
ncbi:MAG: MlaD family protein [Longimicrobiales bacterium]|nr:MlaD family protein [Longimicrobiales bacterium]